MLAEMDATAGGGNGDDRISLLEFLGFFGGLGLEDNIGTEYGETDFWTWTFLPLQVDREFFRLQWGEASTTHTFADFRFY